MGSEYTVQVIKEITGSQEMAERIAQKLTDEGLLVVQYGNQEINTVVDAFKRAFGTTKATKYDRYAAKRLINKHGAESVVAAIDILAANQDAKYCPTVRSVAQIEDKWVSIVRFINGLAITEIEL